MLAWSLAALALGTAGLLFVSQLKIDQHLEIPNQALDRRRTPQHRRSFATCHSRYAGGSPEEKLAAEARAMENFVKIIPHPSEKPFKCRAVLSLFSSESEQPQDDYYFYSEALLMYRLTMLPGTRLPDDVEAAVIAIQNITTEEKIRFFVDMGVRIFLVAPILRDEEVFVLWKHCYSKLYLFAMLFYQYVAFFDADMFPVGKLVDGQDSVFKALEEAAKEDPQQYLFGAVQDVGFTNGSFNAGMMVLEPNDDHYSKLRMLIPYTDLYLSGWMEQGLLNYYFSDRPDCPGGTTWVRVSPRYNMRGQLDLDDIEQGRVVVLHTKIWKTWRQEDKELTALWARGMGDVADWDRRVHNSSILSEKFSV